MKYMFKIFITTSNWGLDQDARKIVTQAMPSHMLHLRTNSQNNHDNGKERIVLYHVTKWQKFIKFLFIQNNRFHWKPLS